MHVVLHKCVYVCMYVSVACDWVVEDADGSHHLAHQPRLTGAEVGRVAHNDGSLRYLVTIHTVHT